MTENAYEPPMQKSRVDPRKKSLPSPSLSQHAAAEAAVIGVAWLGAVIAVPLLYHRTSTIIWISSIAAFAGAPLLVGIIRGRASSCAILIAAALVLACPAVYRIAPFETLRDAFFLATGSTVTFVSAACSANFLRVRRWIRMLASGLVIVVAIGAVYLMITLYMYLV